MDNSGRSSPMVSVVLPTYNRAALLPAVIRSILMQDFTDFELIVIDDGSTDSTVAVVNEIMGRDTRIRYMRLPVNRGLGHARDSGLRHAAGSYIALADSDDVWLPDRLEAQIEILEKYPAIEILFGDFMNIDHVRGTHGAGLEEGQKGLEPVEMHQLEDDLFLVDRGIEIGILKENFIAAPTIVLRKDVIDRIGGFNRALAGTDLEFCWRAAFLGAQYAFVNRPLIERHRHADSMTAQGDRPWLERLDAIEIMYQACLDAGRHELRDHVRATEVRTYRNLIWIYGEQGKRFEAVRAYLGSIRRGISARTTALLMISLLGPRAQSAVQEIRAIHKNGFGMQSGKS